MKKLLIIGIDSLDPELLVKYAEYLPNFIKLRDESPDIKLDSVFPVDSIPAWSSIYTGWNPGRHGIVKTFDIFDADLADILRIDKSIFKGKTFWDYASKSGKKVCSLFPMLAFPPWEVNGIMVTKTLQERRVKGKSEWMVENETCSYPSWVTDEYNIPQFMRGISGRHPGIKNLRNWSDEGKKVLIDEAELGLRICKNQKWDLFFIYFSWLDIIQHRLWRFSDKNDPSHPGRNPYQDIIREFYQIIDGIIGDFIDLYPKATTVVFSDHGHGTRPTKVVNINKVLREEGLLFLNAKKFKYLQYIIERIKLILLDFVNQFELDFWLVDFSTKTKMLSSLSKGIYMSASGDNKKQTIAHLSTFAGIKSYSHGGIEIEKENLISNMDYENVRDLIIKKALALKEPKTGDNLFNMVCKREELYKGPRVSQAYPDIVFQLKEGYGTGWNTYASLIGTSYDHNLASGGHKRDAVFLISNINNKKPSRKNMTLMDVSPTILDILEINNNFDFDGKSIFSNQNL